MDLYENNILKFQRSIIKLWIFLLNQNLDSLYLSKFRNKTMSLLLSMLRFLALDFFMSDFNLHLSILHLRIFPSIHPFFFIHNIFLCLFFSSVVRNPVLNWIQALLARRILKSAYFSIRCRC